jgi:hypothetical protein
VTVADPNRLLWVFLDGKTDPPSPFEVMPCRPGETAEDAHLRRLADFEIYDRTKALAFEREHRIEVICVTYADYQQHYSL